MAVQHDAVRYLIIPHGHYRLQVPVGRRDGESGSCQHRYQHEKQNGNSFHNFFVFYYFVSFG
jgi:hypothetical protein